MTNVGVHAAHCCILHGCKYGHDDCPVATEKVLQAYPCERCSEEGHEGTPGTDEWAQKRRAFLADEYYRGVAEVDRIMHRVAKIKGRKEP